MDNPAVIGLDIGHSSVKISAGSTTDIMPSAAIAAIEISVTEARDAANSDTALVNGKKFFVGQTAIVQSGGVALDGLRDDWIESDEHAALMVAGYRRGVSMLNTDQRPHIALGLPSRLHAQQQKRLVEIAKLHLGLDASQITVLPQALAAYMAMALDQNGQPTQSVDVLNSKWGVVDVGYYTADYGIVNGGIWSVAGAKSAPGANTMASALQAAIAQEHGSALSLRDCDQALHTQSVRLYGTTIDLTKIVERITQNYARTVVDHGNQVFAQNLPTLDKILIVGGGAANILPAIRAIWPQTVGIEAVHMRFAVAEGLRRYAALRATANANKPE